MFCESCGAQVQPGDRACAKCGRPRSAYQSEYTKGRMERHVQLLGVFWIAYSAFSLLGGAVLMVIANTLFGRLGRGEMHTPFFLQPLLSAVGGFLLIKAIAGIAGGYGLIRRVEWARIVVLVLGFLSLLQVPLGTALGIYTIWALLSPGADAEYSAMSRRAA